MIEVIVVGERQTEETFIRDVLAPQFIDRGIRLQPRLIDTSPRGRGGALSKDRVVRVLRNTLRERGSVYVTTMFDLYGLRPDFPGVAAASRKSDPLLKCRVIEEALAKVAIEASDCRPDRFLPHIQPHEFEALLFSNVATFAAVQQEWTRFVDAQRRIRNEAATPEHINDGSTTHPSARLTGMLHPKYITPLHGTRIATAIGLADIRSQCHHFDAWLTRLESPAPDAV